VAKIKDWDSHIGRRLRLRDLHVFFTVVEHGSLAKAASHLGVSHPAVSQLIVDLEHALGTRLFDRSSRGVTPTIYGRALLARGRAAFDELKQGIRDIEFLSDPAVGEVRIGCPEGIEAILVPVIELFSLRYPGVVLDVHVEELETLAVKLRDRRLDFIVQLMRGLAPADGPFFDDLETEVLFDDELVIAAGSQSRWARRRKIDLAHLVDEPWILTGPPTWNYRIVSEAFGLRRLPMPKIVVRTFSTFVRTNLVASGRFIATFPKSVAYFYAGRFSLKVLPIDLPVRPWPLAILTLKNRTLSPVVARFIECTREVVRSMRGADKARRRSARFR
jgi:DNA-binding transcriptional LysR family regulator